MNRLTEASLAREVVSYLTSRGERIATDHGTMTLRREGALAIAEINGERYAVTVIVARLK